MHWQQDEYLNALIFAAQAHKDQKVKDRDYSYMVHLTLAAMEVTAALSQEQHENENLAIQCALLHDTIEDTDVTFEEIKKHFGDDVARGVLALTKDNNLPKNEQIKDSLERILKQPAEIGMVKLADRISNMQRPPSFWPNEKVRSYHDDALTIYEHLKECSPFLANRLLSKIKAYRKFFQ